MFIAESRLLGSVVAREVPFCRYSEVYLTACVRGHIVPKGERELLQRAHRTTGYVLCTEPTCPASSMINEDDEHIALESLNISNVFESPQC